MNPFPLGAYGGLSSALRVAKAGDTLAMVEFMIVEKESEERTGRLLR